MRAAGLIALAALAACKYDKPPFSGGPDGAGPDAIPVMPVNASINVSGLWDNSDPVNVTVMQGGDMVSETIGSNQTRVIELLTGIETTVTVTPPPHHECTVVNASPIVLTDERRSIDIDCDGPARLFIATPYERELDIDDVSIELSVLVEEGQLYVKNAPDSNVTVASEVGLGTLLGGVPLAMPGAGVSLQLHFEADGLTADRSLDLVPSGLPELVQTQVVGGSSGGAAGGRAVAVDWDPVEQRATLAVAAELAVFVYELSSAGRWDFLQMLPEPGVVALAISGRSMLLGVPDDDGGTGKVVPYRRNTTNWSTSQELSGVQANDHFGAALAVAGNRAIIGVPDAGNNDLGAARTLTFDGTTWVTASTLDGTSTPPVLLRANDHFGSSVAIRGTTYLVGSPFDDRSGVGINTSVPADASQFEDRGAAFVIGAAAENFRFLQPPTAEMAGARLGSTVAFAGAADDTSQWLVGAPNAGDAGQGGAWLYDGGAMTVTPLLPEASRPNDHYGRALATTGRVAVIAGSGRVVLWSTAGGITRVAELGDGPPSFGAALAMMPGTLVVGDPEAGTVSIYR